MTANANTLHVEAATTETSPGEFVTDGYRVVANDSVLYLSRSPLKAAIKAIVLTEDVDFKGFAVTFAEGVAGLVGTANLSQRIDADRFMSIRGLAMAEPPVDEIVSAIKAHGNNVSKPDAGTDEV